MKIIIKMDTLKVNNVYNIITIDADVSIVQIIKSSLNDSKPFIVLPNGDFINKSHIVKVEFKDDPNKKFDELMCN